MRKTLVSTAMLLMSMGVLAEERTIDISGNYIKNGKKHIVRP